MLDLKHDNMECYEIIVGSHIDKKRVRDLMNMELRYLPDGKTVILGILKDQSELFSLISRIRDMNLELISINKISKNKEEVLC